ncbi:hypothetical protein J2782_001953 [Brucella pseudogrignonensis]|uniref:Uncharacterized protein n=1 Tax=Brucella pseudogrignonensis TaxID=419475 RepID=A0ABU1M862_9HYPH|nr:hypothetical protein [Brucella pseudogrignonensis]
MLTSNNYTLDAAPYSVSGDLNAVDSKDHGFDMYVR